MVLAPLVGGARKDAVLAPLVEHPLVLDHAALGKYDDLAAVQNFAHQERKQVRQAVRHHADGVEKLAETIVAREKFRRRDRTAIGTGRLVDQVLRNEGLEAGEVIEQKDIALVYRVGVAGFVLVQLDVELQQFSRGAKRLDAKGIDPLVDFRFCRIGGHLATQSVARRSKKMQHHINRVPIAV